ncbi:MAG TPA: hypothetical protein VL371_07555 [Gemmataceae bacterium]|jgi:hypothetical protein|nr:hypothetical protein [Gemmataceae bacterium]
MCYRARILQKRRPITAHWFVAAACTALLAPAARAQITNSTWTGVSGNWSNPALWSTNPFYPQDGNPPGTTYVAVVDAPTSNVLTVDRPISVSRMTWRNGTIAGPGPLTAANGANIFGGTLAGPLIVGVGPTTQVSGSAVPFVITSAGSLTGTADVSFTGSGAGTATINGPYNVSGRTLLGTIPGVFFNAPATMGSLTVGELVGGTADINVAGTLNWVGGEIRGTGRVVAQGSAMIHWNSADYPRLQLTGRTISLPGAANLLSDPVGNISLLMGGGAVVSVESGASLDIAGGAAFTNSGGGGTISNAGIIRKAGSGTAGSTMSIGSGLTLDNRGLLTIQTGPLLINGALKGTGTISGPVAIGSGGVLAPGASPGTLHITGPVTMSGGAKLQLELGGPMPSVGYDQLDLTGGGSIALNGSALETLLGYAPSQTEPLTVILGGPVSGTFAGLPNGTEFFVGRFNATDFVGTITYASTSVVLSNIHAVPEPAAWLLAGGAALAWAWRGRCAKP